MDKLLFTVTEVADALGVGRSKVYELMADGSLYSVKLGRARRVPADAVRRFVDELTEPAA
jgi:excisionase family DNA binding protein